MIPQPVIDDVAAALRAHPFLSGLAEDDISVLADCAELQSLGENTYLTRYQQSAEVFYLLQEGQVVLLSHQAVGGIHAVETLSAPNVVGWSWLVSPYRWHFDVRARTPVRALVVHTPKLLRVMTVDKSFACEMYQRFMQVMVSRLQHARLQNLDIYQSPRANPNGLGGGRW